MGNNSEQRNMATQSEDRNNSMSLLLSGNAMSIASDPNKVDVILAGSDEAHPLLLYSRISLSPCPAIWLESPFPIDVYQGSAQLLMTSTWNCQDVRKVVIEHPMVLIPRAQLQVAFANGWAKLPTQTKLRILQYFIPSQGRTHEDQILSRFLRMAPEISELCKQIFYANKTMELFVDYDDMLSEAAFLTFPPCDSLPSIRKVEVDAPLNAWPDSWNALDSINTLKSACKSLESIRVNLRWGPLAIRPYDACLPVMKSLEGLSEWIELYALEDPERKLLSYNFKVDFVFVNRPWMVIMLDIPGVRNPEYSACVAVTEVLERRVRGRISVGQDNPGHKLLM